jgi:hypothetical protein
MNYIFINIRAKLNILEEDSKIELLKIEL